jgi:hypothetical protein
MTTSALTGMAKNLYYQQKRIAKAILFCWLQGKEAYDD